MYEWGKKKKKIMSSKEKSDTLLWQAIIMWASERIHVKGGKWDVFQEPFPTRMIQWDWFKGDFCWDVFFSPHKICTGRILWKNESQLTEEGKELEWTFMDEKMV